MLNWGLEIGYNHSNAEYGKDWVYPRYVSSQCRKVSCVGVMKSERWEGTTPLEQDLVDLHYNGRAYRLAPRLEEEMITRYWPLLMQLRQLWEEKGTDRGFYDKYYLAKVKQLAGGVTPAGT